MRKMKEDKESLSGCCHLCAAHVLSSGILKKEKRNEKGERAKRNAVSGCCHVLMPANVRLHVTPLCISAPPAGNRPSCEHWERLLVSYVMLHRFLFASEPFGFETRPTADATTAIRCKTSIWRAAFDLRLVWREE